MSNYWNFKLVFSESNIKITSVKIHTERKKNKLKIKKKTKNKTKKPPKKQNSTILPPQEKKKEDNHNILDGAPYGNSQGIEPSTAVARTPTPEAVGILDFLHFYVSAT